MESLDAVRLAAAVICSSLIGGVAAGARWWRCRSSTSAACWPFALQGVTIDATALLLDGSGDVIAASNVDRVTVQ